MSSSSWTNRVWHEFHADNLTRAYRDVLLTLRTYRGAGGLIYPAHAALADRAKCSIRTVQRALWMGERLGLVSWTERRIKAGWRWLKSSNSYRLELPETPVEGGQRPINHRPISTSGHFDRGGENQNKKRILKEMIQAASSLPDLLARRRAAVEQRLLDGRSGIAACATIQERR